MAQHRGGYRDLKDHLRVVKRNWGLFSVTILIYYKLKDMLREIFKIHFCFSQTSFTLSWASYLLARHPHIQQQIYTEVTTTLGPGAVATADDVSRLPLIRGLVKETLRLFPVLPGNGRITQDDLVVGGYFIPKGTQLALCHYSTSFDEENFHDSLNFQPSRWIRKDSTDRVDNFGSIPFGYGIRSCIGKRIAELEMHLALTRLIQKFHICVSPLTSEVKSKTHGLLCPADPINLQFIDREN
ncbi:cytochrome P450 27C1-like [Notothenia coriiceps]|uniref:Cytochrome P450 27C1-like n=1 Tax=Notothenia coriiceps TaxID=8208 RepID=A0A6I9PZK1_9TELE|nr:PREDICTED: cytochrome P450 27C1-like [Notothenia coriiceps]